ncbi:MAG: hypothetical protein AAF961_14295, partial [Planctomycetota bacterium]
APRKAPPAKAAAETVETEAPPADASESSPAFSRFVLQLLSIATVVLCWGAYGPALHKGQSAMQQSRLRPLICVGVAYLALAVIVPFLLHSVNDEPSTFGNISGTFWSLAAGAAGAIGALGIIMAFNFGGKPVYVMPLVFGGAPVVNTLTTTVAVGLWGEITAIFLAGLILVVAGAAIVLVFAPRGGPPAAKAPPTSVPKERKSDDGRANGAAAGPSGDRSEENRDP